MTYTLHRHIDVPRFLTNLSHEKVNIVKLFMRFNEFSSVRHINIARARLEEYMYAIMQISFWLGKSEIGIKNANDFSHCSIVCFL